MTWLRWVVPCAIAYGTSGCIVTGGTPGDLAKGSFDYICDADEDAACGSTGLFDGVRPVPDAIVPGVPFQVRYESTSGGTLKTAAPELLQQTSSGNFVFQRPGVAALLVMDGDAVLDFLHVTGAPIDHLAFAPEAPGKLVGGALVVGPEEDATLHAPPKDAEGHTLGGALTYAWASSDDTVVTVGLTTGLAQALVTGHQPGSATVTATVKGQSFSIPVTVEATP